MEVVALRAKGNNTTKGWTVVCSKEAVARRRLAETLLAPSAPVLVARQLLPNHQLQGSGEALWLGGDRCDQRGLRNHHMAPRQWLSSCHRCTPWSVRSTLNSGWSMWWTCLRHCRFLVPQTSSSYSFLGVHFIMAYFSTS